MITAHKSIVFIDELHIGFLSAFSFIEANRKFTITVTGPEEIFKITISYGDVLWQSKNKHTIQAISFILPDESYIVKDCIISNALSIKIWTYRERIRYCHEYLLLDVDCEVLKHHVDSFDCESHQEHKIEDGISQFKFLEGCIMHVIEGISCINSSSDR